MNLAPLDYLMICVPLLLVTVIAIAMRPFMRSVVDFLAAGRCAGRYLIATSTAQMGGAIMAIVITMEQFSRAGVSIGMWQAFTGIVTFMFLLFGVFTYRFRETRCLTFHQLFEIRYSKGVRVFASILSSISGLIAFGLTPAVGARFFVYFCGMPPAMHFLHAGIPTYIIVMATLMGLSLFFALTGGQISVMVTDCVEGLISSVFYLVIAFAVFHVLSVSQMKTAFLSGPPGQSYIDPFDIGKRDEFDGLYVALSLILTIYIYRGQAWNQGFNAAARTAHEGKMSGLVGFWRGFGPAAMLGMACMGAFTLLHNPAFVGQQQLVAQTLSHIDPQLRTQMSMPMALGILLGPGVKGAFCAIGLFGLLSSQGVALHGIGSTIMQDVVLPLRRTDFTPRRHLQALQWSIVGVAIFACMFGAIYTPKDYLVLLMTLIGAIYAGGVGIVAWGALYWKRGTTAGAWAALVVGAALAMVFNIVQPNWARMQPSFLQWLTLHPGGLTWLSHYVAAHPDRIDSLQLSAATAACAVIAYVAVSLFTFRGNFNMDRMLHRGAHAIASDEDPSPQPKKKRFGLGRFIGIDEHYTLGDKILAVATFIYAMSWKPVTLTNIIMHMIHPQSQNYWFSFQMFTTYLGIGIAIVTTVWLGFGTIKDLIDLFRTLKNAPHETAEDGFVRNHHNVGEEVEMSKPSEPVEIGRD